MTFRPSLREAKAALETLSTVVLIASCSVFLWTTLSESKARASVDARANQGAAIKEHIPSSRVGFFAGSGQVALVEFSDFDCPFCRRFAQDTFPQVKRDLIDSGIVRHVVFESPIEAIHPTAFRASEAAECAGRQGRYWEMRERLFAELGRAEADFDAHSAAVRLDEGEFRACMRDGVAAAEVRADLVEGQRLGVAGTPTFFLGRIRPDGSIDVTRRLNGAISFDSLKAEIDTFLKASK